MTALLDRWLDHVTMYRLALYYLIGLVAAAFVLACFRIVKQDPVAIAFSSAVILAMCWAANKVFARVFSVPANRESAWITALILILILDPVPVTDLRAIGVLAFASLWAIASKYMFAIGRKHLFNPAAFGVLLSGLLLDTQASWWIGGTLPLLPPVLVGGLLLVRKLQRFDTVSVFMLVAIGTVLATAGPSGHWPALVETFRSSPLLFFAFVMLTEPLTAPATRLPRLVFAALVGFLFAPDVHIGTFYFTPEAALLVGNLFAFALSPRGRFVLTLQRIERSAADTYDFVFSSPRPLAFQAGQYLEWTLGLDHADSRGNRRYFTLASAPTEENVRMGVKFYPAPSAFKRALTAMAPGDTIHAAQVAGNFTLPKDPRAKLAFLAGGIGITPFRSMLQELLDRNEPRPIVVLYGNETDDDIAYGDILDTARSVLGIRTYYAVRRGAGRGQYPGVIDARLVKAAIPDYLERTFYISGPQAMVKALRHMLQGIGVHRSRIKVDFFPGFA